MNENQKQYLLKQLALARELDFLYMNASSSMEETMARIQGAARPESNTPRASTPSQPVKTKYSSKDKALLLDEMAASCANCEKCRLSEGRTRVVFGAGNPDADLVFIGEAPGYHEDQQGIPFVGRAGELLTKIIKAMQFERSEVYICNIIKCRPPENRDPYHDEVEQCEPYLMRQIEILEPKVIVCLGRHATTTLLRNVQGISYVRGKWQKFQGIPVMPTYHPSYLLRSPAQKAKVWDDMKKVMQVFGKDPSASLKQKNQSG
jgi:uracil-DNA glycosylase family 4